MTREQELEAMVERLVAAMKEAHNVGCVDHLDCCDDGGEFWYGAIEDAKALLKR